MKTISSDELKEILRLHKMWLSGEDGGLRAALRGADLRGANLRWADLVGADLRGAILRDADLHGTSFRGADLRGANLQGASIDFSSFPLWCGGAYFKADVKLLRQLAAHMCTIDCEDKEWLELKKTILPFAQKSHRAEDLGLIDEEEK